MGYAFTFVLCSDLCGYLDLCGYTLTCADTFSVSFSLVCYRPSFASGPFKSPFDVQVHVGVENDASDGEPWPQVLSFRSGNAWKRAFVRASCRFVPFSRNKRFPSSSSWVSLSSRPNLCSSSDSGELNIPVASLSRALPQIRSHFLAATLVAWKTFHRLLGKEFHP